MPKAAYLLYSVIDASIALATKDLAKILCYINTYPATHLSRALHVKLTWARKCNKHLFMSSETDKELGAVKTVQAAEEGTLFQTED
ncbi:hypothetical protein X801_06122 [Opisthorchis viverrini]|uniref:Uncharacterized protein n=1 Tax=Opisthorchis viverrini TaxID=6198 RepID=A0A1S8WUW5_OPIVI|nr:hypothetical protein X801_06122 [Opisthorchis viverrini]